MVVPRPYVAVVNLVISPSFAVIFINYAAIAFLLSVKVYDIVPIVADFN